MREDVSGDLSPSISFSKKGTKIQENIKENSQTARAAVKKNTKNCKERNLPGASDNSRVPKGSGTINKEFVGSTSRIVDGRSTREEEGLCLV